MNDFNVKPMPIKSFVKMIESKNDEDFYFYYNGIFKTLNFEMLGEHGIAVENENKRRLKIIQDKLENF